VSEPTDWIAWHRQYDEAGSSLSRRLAVVRSRLERILNERRVTTVLSLCAGDGRDLIPILAGREAAPMATLVEAHPDLAAAAALAASEAGLSDQVCVRVADAGVTASFSDVLPVDLLMLCGIFGNISETDIRVTISAVGAITAPDATVVWTRGCSDPDLRPAIRGWLAAAGFDDVGFEAEPDGFGVGVARRTPNAAAGDLPDRLFTFLR